MTTTATNRNRTTGRYTVSKFETPCQCGHTLGAHTADRRGTDQPCLTDGCDCESFTKATKDRAAVALGRRGGASTSARKAEASRANGAKGGRPRTRRPRRLDLIQEEYRDSDGYWIYLTPGWQNGLDPGTHGIHEDTKRAARENLAFAKPCDCKECLELVAERQAKQAATSGGE